MTVNLASSTVCVETNGSIYTVIINRPEVKNAVDGPTAVALAEAFREFDSNDNYAVAVLCGAGNTFCAGADLKALAGNSHTNTLAADGDGPMGPSRMLLGKPVIAAIAGHAVAGGLELALWCDMRVAEGSATFGVYCRRFGVPLVDGGTVRLPRTIGMSRAMDMILTGRAVDAAEALQMGLANRVVEDGRARAEAEQLAAQIAAFPQLCMRHDRLSAHQQWGMPYADALANEFTHGMASLQDGDARSGARAFVGGVGKHGKFE
nr:putative enoyl-CoA hydratase [uncultured bacterium]